MKKVLFLTVLGLFMAGPLTAQAVTTHGKVDFGPWPGFIIENPCTPGDDIDLTLSAKGTWSRTNNSQGNHYVRNVQWTGTGVGSQTGLVFTVHNPAVRHEFVSSGNETVVFRNHDEMKLVGKGDNGVVQRIEFLWVHDVYHVRPDGTYQQIEYELGSPICTMNKIEN
jgi:hypothetical protein